MIVSGKGFGSDLINSIAWQRFGQNCLSDHYRNPYLLQSISDRMANSIIYPFQCQRRNVYVSMW